MGKCVYRVDSHGGGGIHNIHPCDIEPSGAIIINKHDPVIKGLPSQKDAEYFCSLLNDDENVEVLRDEIKDIKSDGDFKVSGLSLSDWYQTHRLGKKLGSRPGKV